MKQAKLTRRNPRPKGKKETFVRTVTEGALLYTYHLEVRSVMLMCNPPKERRTEINWRNVYGIVDGEMQFLRTEEAIIKQRKVETTETYIEWPDDKDGFIPAY